QECDAGQYRHPVHVMVAQDEVRTRQREVTLDRLLGHASPRRWSGFADATDVGRPLLLNNAHRRGYRKSRSRIADTSRLSAAGAGTGSGADRSSHSRLRRKAGVGKGSRRGVPFPSGWATMTCALVPPSPNELTPATRGRSAAHRRSSGLGKNGDAAKSNLGFGFWQNSVAGISPRSTASTAFTRPAMPAARSRWPTFDLTLPMAHHPTRSLVSWNTSVS